MSDRDVIVSLLSLLENAATALRSDNPTFREESARILDGEVTGMRQVLDEREAPLERAMTVLGDWARKDPRAHEAFRIVVSERNALADEVTRLRPKKKR